MGKEMRAGEGWGRMGQDGGGWGMGNGGMEDDAQIDHPARLKRYLDHSRFTSPNCKFVRKGTVRTG